jgi:hypothetical protein
VRSNISWPSGRCCHTACLPSHAANVRNRLCPTSPYCDTILPCQVTANTTITTHHASQHINTKQTIRSLSVAASGWSVAGVHSSGCCPQRLSRTRQQSQSSTHQSGKRPKPRVHNHGAPMPQPSELDGHHSHSIQQLPVGLDHPSQPCALVESRGRVPPRGSHGDHAVTMLAQTRAATSLPPSLPLSCSLSCPVNTHALMALWWLCVVLRTP